eukprot:scaffold114580_cov45-Attheya_sp.AAC.2
MAPSTNSAPKSMRGPAVVVGCTALITVGSIFYSHYAQVRDKRVMKEGVQRDKERLKWKKQQRKQEQLLLQESKNQST